MDEVRTASNIVTSDNLGEFLQKKLDLTPPEPKQTEEVKLADVEVKTEEKSEKKNNISERFSEMSKQRKAMEERAQKAEERATKAEEERQKLALELEDAKKPPEPVEPALGAKPESKNFQDPAEHTEALIQWHVKKDRLERAVEAEKARTEAERETVISNWNKHLDEVKAEIEDYEEKVGKSSVVVSEQVREAILESDIGPKILYHFANHPEEAARIGKLTVTSALRELGKIEAQLTTTKKPDTKQPETKEVKEVSRAAPPISPLKGVSVGAENLVDGSTNEFKGSYKQYKELRKQGKIA